MERRQTEPAAACGYRGSTGRRALILRRRGRRGNWLWRGGGGLEEGAGGGSGAVGSLGGGAHVAESELLCVSFLSCYARWSQCPALSVISGGLERNVK